MRSFGRIALLLLAPVAAFPADAVFHIPPVSVAMAIADQPVAVTVSGTVQIAEQVIRLQIDAGLADLQRQITPILRAELNQDNHCGDRLTVDQATLTPDTPASLLTANVHYEKWACAKAFGKEIVKRLIGGNGTIRMRLTPAIENQDSVQLRADVLSIDADGSLGEALRSGSFGDALQEKIRKTIVAAIEKSMSLNQSIPAGVRGLVALKSVQFSDSGAGSLGLNLAGEARITPEQAKDLAELLKTKIR